LKSAIWRRPPRYWPARPTRPERARARGRSGLVDGAQNAETCKARKARISPTIAFPPCARGANASAMMEAPARWPGDERSAMVGIHEFAVHRTADRGAERPRRRRDPLQASSSSASASPPRPRHRADSRRRWRLLRPRRRRRAHERNGDEALVPETSMSRRTLPLLRACGAGATVPRLAPEDASRVAVDLVEQRRDLGGRSSVVVAVPALVPVAPEERPVATAHTPAHASRRACCPLGPKLGRHGARRSTSVTA
jgi:hypothetical protein